VGGKDDLKPTRKVVASPPMATLAPKSSQSIRVVRVSKEPVAGEESYRLLIDEIIDPATAPKVGVAVQMRYSVPVFVESAEGKPASVAVTAEMAGNSLRIKAVNSGGMFAQAADVSLEYAGGISTPVADGLLGYVLPGKTMQWALDVPGNAAASGNPCGCMPGSTASRSRSTCNRCAPAQAAGIDRHGIVPPRAAGVARAPGTPCRGEGE
jgi:fimbrial chaperone protein